MNELRRIRSDAAFGDLKALAIEWTGLAYYEGRDELFARIVWNRLQESNADGCADYSRLVQADAAERQRLESDLTIGETHFFRHPEMFDELRETILPEWLRTSRPDRPLRIWSAGCSIGAEAYTFSILLRRDLAAALGTRPVTILGTDINARFLNQARAAEFAPWALRGVDDALRDQCFHKSETRWRLADRFRRDVSFRSHNLVTDPFPSADLRDFDVIACRNVMIYFAPDVIAALQERFRDALAPGGWLLTGHADPSPSADLGLRRVMAGGATLYQRTSEKIRIEVAPRAKPERRAPEPRRKRRRRRASTKSKSTAPAFDLRIVRALCDAGAWSDVERKCTLGIRQDPLRVDAYLLRGLAHEQLGDIAAAESDLRRVLYLDPTHALANFHVGRIAWADARRDDAARLFRAAAEGLAGRDADEAVDGASDLTVEELVRILEAHESESRRA